MTLPRYMPRARRTAERKLMPDVCTLYPAGGGAEETVCGVVDPRRTPDTPRTGDQLTVKGSTVFRLPVTAPDMPLGSSVAFGERTYRVVDPGPPVHNGMLARYVGCDEDTQV